MNDEFPVSQTTLKLIRRYLPEMNVTLPLDEDSACRVYDCLFDMEVGFAMDAEDLRRNGGDWESAEKVSNTFAGAVDEFGDYCDSDAADCVLLSKMISEQVPDPADAYPGYRRWSASDDASRTSGDPRGDSKLNASGRSAVGRRTVHQPVWGKPRCNKDLWGVIEGAMDTRPRGTMIGANHS